MFDVYAVHDPGSDPVKLGEIRLKSLLRRSVFGDTRLFFRHSLMIGDLNGLWWNDVPGGWHRGNKWAQAIKWNKTEWDKKPIPELPPDNDDALRVLTKGILEQGCPFAWLL